MLLQHISLKTCLDEVIIDFTPDLGSKKPYITSGSFYVAITRARSSKDVYLKDFNPNYIKVDKSIAEKIYAMQIVRPYKF